MAAADNAPHVGGSTPSERERYNARERKRRQRARDRAKHGGAARRNEDIAAIIGKGRDDVIREVMAEELRPVVREAIDQDAVRAIKGMVGLAPAAILVLAEGLESEDEVVRQRSAALIAKYTLGNPMVTPPRDDGGGKLVIINAMPRPEAPTIESVPYAELPLGEPPQVAYTEADVVEGETRRCDTCNLVKPLSEFPGDGPRCRTCLEERKQAVIEQFLKPDEREALLSENALRESATGADVQRPSAGGGSQVHQAGAGLQPGDVRSTWVDQIRNADPEGHTDHPAQRAPVRSASGIFPGPPDPKRWSTGS